MCVDRQHDASGVHINHGGRALAGRAEPGFVKPFEGHNKVVFTLAPKGDATEVIWDMRGPSPYITKVITVFCDMDAMIGKQFETGLANLKTVAEK